MRVSRSEPKRTEPIDRHIRPGQWDDCGTVDRGLRNCKYLHLDYVIVDARVPYKVTPLAY